MLNKQKSNVTTIPPVYLLNLVKRSPYENHFQNVSFNSVSDEFIFFLRGLCNPQKLYFLMKKLYVYAISFLIWLRIICQLRGVYGVYCAKRLWKLCKQDWIKSEWKYRVIGCMSNKSDTSFRIRHTPSCL